jgi:phosphate-selective porin OprO and OprP
MRSKVLIALSFTVFLFLSIPLIASAADQTDKLIDILVKKGIITKDEAAALEKEVKGEEAAKDDRTKKMEIGYDRGAYVKTKDDKFSLKMNVRLQGQFNYSFLDDRSNTTTFTVRRARIITSGNAFHKWLKYNVQLTLEGSSVALRDAFMEADYYKGFVPALGQFKVPFDREFLTSAFSLQLIDRSLANDEFNLGRDVGLQIAGFPSGDLFEYRLGMFNGSGGNRNNVNNEFIYLGRLVLTPFGPYPYSQAALDEPKKPLLAIGVAGAFLPDLEPGERRSLAGRLGDEDVMPVTSDVYQFVGDLAFKFCNFSFEGGYYYRIIDPQAPTPLGRTNAWGYYAQAGYFLIPKKFEIAGRYSYVNPDNPNERSNNNQYELTGGVSYYFAGHPLKVQANYTYLNTDRAGGDLSDHIVRTQVTLMF